MLGPGGWGESINIWILVDFKGLLAAPQSFPALGPGLILSPSVWRFSESSRSPG